MKEEATGLLGLMQPRHAITINWDNYPTVVSLIGGN